MSQQPYPSEQPGQFWDQFTAAVNERYGWSTNDDGRFKWFSRVGYDIAAGLTAEQSAAKHLAELDTELGGPPTPPPSGDGPVQPIAGYLRLYGRSFGDDSGPRIIHGCTWFPALCIAREDWDECLRQLDRIRPYQQYVRVGWRINGRPWDTQGLTIDPITQPGYEALLHRFLVAAWDRRIRVVLTCCDMYHWTHADAERWFRRVAEVAASVSQQVMCLNDGLNEMRGTHPDGEAGVGQMAQLMSIARAAYPWGQVGVSDPASQDQAGMQRMSPLPATVAQIHDVRTGVADACRRAFNTAYENYPGLPIHQREPTGPNAPGGPPNGMVFQPVNDPAALLAIYTLHVLTGQMSTYFADPALINRAPLDATWGFTELPARWRDAGIPQDIGQGGLKPGHHADAPLQVVGSGADRADGAIAPDGRYYLGVVSGGRDWRVKTTWDADLAFVRPDGVHEAGRVSAGQTVVSLSGEPAPVVVRLTR